MLLSKKKNRLTEINNEILLDYDNYLDIKDTKKKNSLYVCYWSDLVPIIQEFTKARQVYMTESEFVSAELSENEIDFIRIVYYDNAEQSYSMSFQTVAETKIHIKKNLDAIANTFVLVYYKPGVKKHA